MYVFLSDFFRFTSFFDFPRFKTFYADLNLLRASIDHSPYRLEVREEAADRYTGDLNTDAAFFLRKTAMSVGSASDRPFFAYLTYVRHLLILL